MNVKMISILFIPVLLYACTTFKPVEKLTDTELIDTYYKTDLNLYMVKRDAGKTGSAGTAEGFPEYGGAGSAYSSRDTEKIRRLEERLLVMKEELIKRGYIP